MLQQAALALVAALAMAANTCAEAGRDYGAGQSKFTITGTVLCQDCTKNWNAYACNAKPIPGTFLPKPFSLRRTSSSLAIAPARSSF